MRTNRAWTLVARPEGLFKADNFRWVEAPIEDPADGQVLVRQLLLSLDPTNRGWANQTATYLPPLPIGSVMRGLGLGVVEASRHPAFSTGDYVHGLLGWQLYALSDGTGLTRIERAQGIPLDAYLSVFSHIGATAYFGLLEIGRPAAGETLVVSAAAGAVGSLVGQIGKIAGCRVVGIAGSEEKCRWLTEELGFDAAVTYRDSALPRKLRRACPSGIDVVFENVGGDVLDASLMQVNQRARVVLCGMIAQYNEPVPPPGPRFLVSLLTKRARMEGFIVLDYADRYPEAFRALEGWWRDGRLRYRSDIVDGLEHAPTAVNRLFDGTNAGKLIVRVSAED